MQDSSGKHVYVLKAVEAINIIEDLLLNIAHFHPHWCHLLKTVDSRIDKILVVLRPQVLADHRGVLASLGWPPKVLTSRIEGGVASSIPNPLVLMQRDKREKYSQSFLALCALQHVQKRRDDRPSVLSGMKKDSYVGLWAIDELASPIASRVEHHFLKWVDQPEIIFALVYKIIHDFIEGIDDVLQPLIDRARLVSCSAKEAWVSSMVQTLSGFLVKRVFPVLVARYKDKHSKEGAISDWLHLIDNIISFDKRVQLLLRSETSLFLGESEMFMETSTSTSVLSLFHDRPGWLHTWAKVEVKDAWKKLKSELKQERAWDSDKNQGDRPHGKSEADHYLMSSREDFKAPPIAEFALKFAWHMIERCQNLPVMSGRVKFIRSGAVKFLWHFFNVLLLRFQKTEFPAYDSEEALVRVCQLINVARFCESKLQEWSDDVNFLELRVSEKESKMAENGNFFDEEIRSLAELQTNWLSEVVAQVLRQFESYSFEYLEDVQRFEQAMDSTAASAVSDDLGEALDSLRGQLLLIRKHLNPKDFLDLWRSIADGLDLFVFRSIISYNARFSKDGARQLETDLQGLFLVFGTLCSRPEAFFPCIRDLLRALKMGREDSRYLESFVGMGEGRIGTRRDFILKDYSNGEVIGRATSKWVMMNQDTRRLERVTAEIHEEYLVFCPKELRLAFPEKNNKSLRKILKLEDPAQHSKLGLVTRRADLDMNQHVNNVTYIGWLLESMPQEIIDTHELQSITLDYRRECQHDDIVDSLTTAASDKSTGPVSVVNGSNGSLSTTQDHNASPQFQHLLRLSGNGAEINRGYTEWRKKPQR